MTVTREIPRVVRSLVHWRPTAALIALISFAGFGFWSLTVTTAGTIAEERLCEARYEAKFSQTCRRRCCPFPGTIAGRAGALTNSMVGVLSPRGSCGPALSPHLSPLFLGAGITRRC
jgi:hypothetical protein